MFRKSKKNTAMIVHSNILFSNKETISENLSDIELAFKIVNTFFYKKIKKIY